MALLDPLFDPTNLVATLILTFSPIIVLFFPFLFTRRKEDNLIAVIFNRGYLGFIVFYIGYFIFPSLLNSVVPNPTQYLDQEYYPVLGANGYSTEWDSAATPELATIPGVPLLIRYLFQHFLNSIVNYLYYPLVILAFVFGISPFISIGILMYQTWSEKRTERKPLNRLIKQNNEEIKNLQAQIKEASTDKIQELNQEITSLEKDNDDLRHQITEVRSVIQRVQEIQFEMETSPFQEITVRVKKKDWDNEKELLKVLIAILPISLFILMTILQIFGETENPSLLQGTSMGHFLEIFFAYIASVVFSVYLIKASRLSRKGKFLGNQLYVAMVQSLSTVGAFMSVLAVALFLIQYTPQIFVISYFVVYFVMVSIFFVLFLDILEPFSAYILIKLIESFKNLKMAIKRINFTNMVKSILMGVIVGFLLAVGFLTYRVFASGLFDNIQTVSYDSFFWFTQNYAAFLICASLILFIRRWNWSLIGTTIVTYLSMLIVTLIIFGWYDLELYTLLGYSSIFPSVKTRLDEVVPLIQPFLMLTSTFGTQRLEWLTAIWKEGYYNEIRFIIPELHSIPVVWKGGGGAFLGTLSLPYNFLHPFAIILTYGAILFLAGRGFHVRTQKSEKPGEEKIQYKSVFSDVGRLVSLTELQNKKDIILLGATPIDDPELSQKINEVWLKIKKGQNLRDFITDKTIPLDELISKTDLTLPEIHHILDDLTFDLEVPFKQVITLLHREFSYSFEEVTIDSLHIMMLDGRAVLAHNFATESQVEPALVAGLFSAITSFAKEAVRSEQLLKTIDHGDVVLTIEYAKWVFAAIFADSTSTELRKKLSEFLTDFETRHAKILPTWLGNLDVFEGDVSVIDDIFAGR